MRIIIPLVLALFICGAVLADTAYLDPDLENILIEAEADDLIDVYVVLEQQVDLDKLTSRFGSKQQDLRHEAVISSLMELAEDTQADLLGKLATDDAVTDLKPFWIQNAIGLTAKPAVIWNLLEQRDVAAVYFDAPIELIAPVEVGENEPASAGKGVENGITVSRAPELWAMGIDGTGTLACDQDTGADGNHPAFKSRWRGLVSGVTPQSAWFDPTSGETFPTDSGSHGTHTLGTMIGDDGGSNRIGMAPGAMWIGAKTIDVSGGNIFTDAVAAFQWAADPDGNPGTTDDVPDVVNNSWGLSSGYGSCRSDFNASIDAAEAAGVVVVFAAGNEGEGPETLRSPGNRISTRLNSFAVGALNQDNQTAADFSSRGPSDCDGSTLKPEVSAVGVNVRSSTPSGNYGSMSGTSMATPHVAGGVLLLRDAFPEATVAEIKYALYTSADDLGDAGEDHVYGMGRIDMMDAYQALLLIRVACTSNAQCNDGNYCNGVESCNLATNLCEFGVQPCAANKACLESNDSCVGVEIPDEPGWCGVQDSSSGLAALLLVVFGLYFIGRQRSAVRR